MNSRELALKMLSRVESDNAYINVLLDTEFRKSPELDPRDKSLVTELVYGVVRWQKTLDWYLDQVCKKPMSNTSFWLRHILRLGAYQLLMLDRIPASAAINESVKLAGKYSRKIKLPARTAKGFVNAALRQIERSRTSLRAPETLSDVTTRLATQYSFPQWIVTRWVQRFGEDATEELCRINNQPSLVTLRVNTLKTSVTELQQQLAGGVKTVQPLPGGLSGLVVSGAPSISSLSCYHDGFFSVQNASSMLISLILDPKPGETILEVCAGAGIKTTHLGELMQNRGKITAVDLHAGKLRRLRENCNRVGITIAQTFRGDMTTSLDLPGFDRQGERGFDRVLVDAPCSGLGVLRKHPEAKWTKNETEFAKLQHLQLRLLTQAATLVHADGGVLVYSTCTTEPEENEAVIEHFLHTVPGFRVDPPTTYLPEQLQPFVTEEGFLRIVPPQHEFDGFFCVRLIRHCT